MEQMLNQATYGATLHNVSIALETGNKARAADYMFDALHSLPAGMYRALEVEVESTYGVTF